jgi:hypothetical protein
MNAHLHPPLSASLVSAQIAHMSRRTAVQPDSHTQWDFLKGGEATPTYGGGAENASAAAVADVSDVGVSGARQSRFKKGFYRRAHDKINPEEQRVKLEAEKADRAEKAETIRREYLAQKQATTIGQSSEDLE